MTSTNLRIRPATLEDSFIAKTGRFVIVEDDDGVIAFGGVIYESGSVEAVMEVWRDGFGPSVARASKSFQGIFAMHNRVIARQGNNLTAPRYLKWLGFVPIGKIDNKVFWEWRKREAT
jgi:hypothetical protein